MSLGLSGFIMAVTNSLVQIVCNITIGAYGGDLYIGVMTILNVKSQILQSSESPMERSRCSGLIMAQENTGG